MVDVALREIESAAAVYSFPINRSVPIKYGPLTEQDSIPDYYPLWFAWVSFSLLYSTPRNIRDIEKFL